MAIVDARAKQGATGVKQIVGLVWYNLPDHDCSGGEASGEFDSTKGGMERYQREFGQPLTDKLSAASDLEFVIVLESDAVGNIVTNQESVPFCARAAPVYEERIAYSISILKQANVHIYLDIAHEGWLSWPDNLPKSMRQEAYIPLPASSLVYVLEFKQRLRQLLGLSRLRARETRCAALLPTSPVTTPLSPKTDPEKAKAVIRLTTRAISSASPNRARWRRHEPSSWPFAKFSSA